MSATEGVAEVKLDFFSRVFQTSSLKSRFPEFYARQECSLAIFPGYAVLLLLELSCSAVLKRVRVYRSFFPPCRRRLSDGSEPRLIHFTSSRHQHVGIRDNWMVAVRLAVDEGCATLQLISP